MNISLEITENNYLIRLPKQGFDLERISALMARMRSEQLTVKNSEDDDLISRRLSYDCPARFDDLADK